MNISEWMKKYFGKLRSAASLRYAKGSTEKIKPVHRQIEVAALSFYFSNFINAAFSYFRIPTYIL